MQMYMFFCEILMMFTKQTSPRQEACECVMYEESIMDEQHES
jgi:hypothetical protein